MTVGGDFWQLRSLTEGNTSDSTRQLGAGLQNASLGWFDQINVFFSLRQSKARWPADMSNRDEDECGGNKLQFLSLFKKKTPDLFKCCHTFNNFLISLRQSLCYYNRCQVLYDLPIKFCYRHSRNRIRQVSISDCDLYKLKTYFEIWKREYLFIPKHKWNKVQSYKILKKYYFIMAKSTLNSN